MSRAIVVPLDGSELALGALPLAVAIARAWKARLELVRVHLALADGETVALAQLDAEIRAREEEYLARTAADISRGTGLEAETAIAEDPAGAAIADRAAVLHADLIVMTTHGYTGLTRLWLGSVADGVLRHATIPVLLVRPREPVEAGAEDTGSAAPAPDLGTWLRPAPLPGRILIPLDGSDRAEAIVPHATALGKLGDASYTLLQVVKPVRIPLHPYPYLAPMFETDAAEQQAAVERARGYLDGVAARIRARTPGASVRTEVCVDDRPATAIVERAKEGDADVIALTTSGHGIARLVAGSVADKVLRAAERPLLIVRPEEPRR